MRLTREGKKRIKRVWILALVYLVAVIGFFFVFGPFRGFHAGRIHGV